MIRSPNASFRSATVACCLAMLWRLVVSHRRRRLERDELLLLEALHQRVDQAVRQTNLLRDFAADGRTAPQQIFQNELLDFLAGEVRLQERGRLGGQVRCLFRLAGARPQQLVDAIEQGGQVFACRSVCRRGGRGLGDVGRRRGLCSRRGCLDGRRRGLYGKLGDCRGTFCVRCGDCLGGRGRFGRCGKVGEIEIQLARRSVPLRKMSRRLASGLELVQKIQRRELRFFLVHLFRTGRHRVAQ
jgi:hypothetical protein